jgi:ribosomal protein S18 acetylase RimI-like enzyme
MPRVSRVAVSKKTNKPVGVLLASKIAKTSGHISQISILPAYQGQGLGRTMIRSTMAEYRRRGFKTVSLAVTGVNVRAVRLYESCGFQTVHTFPVFYLDR